MPTSVVMYIWVKRRLDADALMAVRSEMVDRFQSSDTQLFHDDYPLSHVESRDCKYIPVQGKPGLLLNVNIWHDYYGLGYERGYLPNIVKVAERLEQKFPGCVIFHGGDSAYNMRLFDGTDREKLLKYYNTVGRRPYECQDLEMKRRYREPHDA